MKKYLSKCMIIALTGMMLTTTPKMANALIPLPSIDFSRIAENVKKTISQVTEIKAEIDSNIMILREIQNGGYAAAAGMLFSKIERGDYDRLGRNVKGVSENYDALTMEFKGMSVARKECKERAKKAQADALEKYKKECEQGEKTEEELKQCMEDVKKAVRKIANKELRGCEEEMNKATGEAIADMRKKNRDKAAAKAAEENKDKGGKAKFKSVYSWVKGAKISKVANGVGAGDDFSSILKNAGSSAGSILGDTGNGETGKFIEGATKTISGATDVVNQGGSVKDMVVNAANNSDISSGLDNVNDANRESMEKQRKADEDALNQKIADDWQKAMEDAMKNADSLKGQ